MAGRRILDAAKLIQAARSVVKQHVALRSEQLERYNRTSTLAKQAKTQSDRILLTLQAAAALAKRLNEDDNADQYGNAGPSARAEDLPLEGTATPDDKSSIVRREKPAIPASVDNDAPTIHQNVDGESRNGAEKITGRGLNNENRDGQVLSNKPRSSTKGSDETAEGIDLDALRTRRVSQMLGSQNDAEETKYSTSNESLASSTAGSTAATGATTEPVSPDKTIQQASSEMRQSRVPATRIGRLWQYGGLATSMALGAIGESLRRATGSSSEGSLILNPANMERLVARLSRMRGAALKLGQMISFQGR
jgi:aarF domain-containing kinase